MRIIILTLVSCLLATPAVAETSKTKKKVALAASTTLLVADWLQTRYIADHPEKYEESWNVILKGHPTRGQVDAYFGAIIVGNYLIYKYLPDDMGFWANMLVASMEMSAVANNITLGVGVSF